MAASISERLASIEEKIDHTVAQVNGDPGTSPALKAVVSELHTKVRRARNETRAADQQAIRDHVIEAEQAADSAKKAAEADPGITESTRKNVLEAHAALCGLKDELI